MEKFYIVRNQKVLQDIDQYKKNRAKRINFINDFFQRYNIDGERYYLGGSGFVNVAFDEDRKKDIALCIENTENNLSRFGADFKKTRQFTGLKEFKENSAILNDFQQECIKKRLL